MDAGGFCVRFLIQMYDFILKGLKCSFLLISEVLYIVHEMFLTEWKLYSLVMDVIRYSSSIYC